MGCLLYPEGMLPMPGNIPDQTTEDLQLERLAAFMSWTHYLKISAAELNALWTEDPAVISHRQAVLRDILENPELGKALDMLLGCIDGWEGRAGGIRRGLDNMAVGINMTDFGNLDSYIKKLDAVYNELGKFSFRSAGMKALYEKLGSMRCSERFENVKKSFEALCRGYAAPKLMRLGFNLDGELKLSAYKLLYMEQYTGEEEKKSKKRKLWFTQKAMETNNMLLQRSVQSASQAIGAFVSRETMEFRSVKKDLIFFLSLGKLCRAWEEKGLKWCFPKLCPVSEKAFAVKDMFNPLLVVGGRETIITNDIELKKGGEILVLTGANQGGKTVFLLSTALTQWLFQLGAAVPCESAQISPVSGIFTVFSPNNTEHKTRGLLAEEAQRIANVVSSVKENSMVLFNEPLTSTSPSETKSISLDVIAAFKAVGMHGVWVTHIHELASERSKIEAAIPWGSSLGSIRIVMDRTGDESVFTYKVERAEPEFNSYASEVLRRKGVTLGALHSHEITDI